MNFHSDEWIMDRVWDHYADSRKLFPGDRIVCLTLAGSQNYGLDMEDSDVDTKLITVPAFRDIAMNKTPVSGTHVRENGEHIDAKDVRLYMQTFRKMNVNFLEVLFSPYTIVNHLYTHEWNRLVEAREGIARYDIPRAIKAMLGTVHTKYKLIHNESENRAEAIKKFGYSPKDLYQFERAIEVLDRYIAGEPYANCLISRRKDDFERMKNGQICLSVEDIDWVTGHMLRSVSNMCDKFLEKCDKTVRKDVDELLDDVQYNIMKIAIENEDW